MGLAGWFHLVAFGLLMPLAAFKGKRRLEQGTKLPPKRDYLVSLVLQLVIFGAVSALVARLEWIRLFPAFSFTGKAITLAVGVFAVHALIGQYRTRLRVRKRDPKLWLMMPTDGVERALWIAISLAAAVGEEITYRGVLIELVQRLGVGFPFAVAICALAFGLAHSTQSWTAAAIITGYAVLMHLLAAYSGSLYLGMLLHFLHDLWIGLFVAWLAKRAGWKPEPYSGSGSP